MKYDPFVVQTIAQQLHDKANYIYVIYGVLGIIAGCLIGYSLFSTVGYGVIGLVIGAVIGFFVGNEIGLSKSLFHKFHAQMLLTQLEIEKNTHRLIEISATTSEIIDLVQDLTDTEISS
jgi:hypothetical protein